MTRLTPIVLIAATLPWLALGAARTDGAEPGAGELRSPAPATAPADAFPVAIHVDAAAPRGELRPVWRFFGADEPNYAYMKDGRKLLKELGELGESDGSHGAGRNVYFRAHNLLTSGDGTPALKWGSTGAYHQDEQGRPVYDWTILDRIFDAYLQNGLHPYVQIGFMPKDLSVHPEPYQHHWRPGAKYDEIATGWSYPPSDYDKWRELAFQWAKHCVEKYGKAEVERWYWEVWNEPNGSYWHGSPEEFFKLHDYAIDGVRRALPTARVGGPDVAGSGGKFTRDFLEHCLNGTNFATGEKGGRKKTPLDFVSFHAKGAPRFVEGHVRMGIAEQLRAIDSGFGIVASFPQLKDKPIVLGESDPDGCAACQGPQLGYRNGTMYSSYTAASFAREYDLAERHGVNLEGSLTWAFEFEGQPYFAGFRALATNGIDLPVLNVFRMFAKMGGRRVAAESDAAFPLDAMLKQGVRGKPDVAALACVDAGVGAGPAALGASGHRHRLCALVWHYHDDDVPGPAATVKLTVSGLPVGLTEARLEHFRIDADHSNAFTAWQRMGSPQQPTPEQYAELERAGRLQALAPPRTIRVEKARAVLTFELPRPAVSLLVLGWD